MVSLRRILGRLLLFAWVALVVLRVDLLQAYGRGTGKNKLAFSPLDVASQATLYSARLRGHDSLIKNIFAVAGVPGEVYRQLSETQSLGSASNIWESAQKWSKDTKLKPVFNPSKDPLSSLAAMGCVLSILVALKFPQQASMMFLLGLVGLQTSLRANEPTVRFTDEAGNYALMITVAASIMFL